jgi:hypothetical protein
MSANTVVGNLIFNSTSTYGVLAGTTVTNTGSTTITGDLGLSPGSSVTGSPTVTGTSNIANPAAVQAKTDLITLYDAAAALPGVILASGELGGLTLAPGVYKAPGGFFAVTSVDLTLDAAGNPDAFWVFQMASTLTIGNGRSIILANGAQAKNVFWQVGSSATIGTTAVFNGTIAALTTITLATGAQANGGLFARNGAVNLDTNIVTSASNANITVGNPSNSFFQILYRDLTLFTDNGAQYDAFFEMGNIMLAHPGQLAVLSFIEADFSGISYQPTISYLLNEINGTFTPFTAPPQFDPPSLYGTTITPVSYSPNRYYFMGTGSLARCRHLRIRVDLGTTPNGDELYNLCIFGRLMIEL